MLLYSVTGDHFVYGSRITWSIMPDGTNLGSVTSNLVSTLNQKLGNGWLNVISDAFAQWENISNVNFAQVGDDGAAFGSGNYQQGSPEYGDIRIGGFAQSQGTLSITVLPPTANGGSNSGDILLNTNQTWNIGSNYDLETVVLHEIGHSLGMGHSTDATAVMYPYYGGVDNRLGTDDINRLRSIWGPRQEDPVEVNTGNTVSSRAAILTGFINPSNNQAYMPGLDVANTGEGYWFKVTTPSNSNNVLTVQVQSSNLSELSPRVQIYNASLQGLVQASASATSYGTTIQASIGNVTPNTVYYVKILGSNAGPTGTGAYAMTINMGGGAIALAPPPNTSVVAQADQGGGLESVTVGGAGSFFKSMILAVTSIPNLSSIYFFDAPIVTDLTQLQNDLVATAYNYSQIEAVLIGFLQDLPGDLSDDLLSQWGIQVTGSLKLSRLHAILDPIFSDLKTV